MESTDECQTLLQVACLQLNDYGSQTKDVEIGSVWTLKSKTTGQRKLIFLDESGGCEESDVHIQHEMTSATRGEPMNVSRKSLDRRLKQGKVQQAYDIETNDDAESIVKLRLFFATAVLWIVWLLVYVILSRWRLI